jgi:hypothetical protein
MVVTYDISSSDWFSCYDTITNFHTIFSAIDDKEYTRTCIKQGNFVNLLLFFQNKKNKVNGDEAEWTDRYVIVAWNFSA